MSDSIQQTPGQEPPQRNIQTYVFGGILIVLFVAVCRLFAPFFTVLLWSTLLYVVLSPLHHKVIQKTNLLSTRGKILKSVWAGVFAMGTIILILIPLSLIASVFSRQIIELLRYARDLFNQKPQMLRELFDNIARFIRDISVNQVNISGDDIQQHIMGYLTSGLQNLLLMSGNIARNIGGFIFSIVLMIFCLFFFYADGPYLAQLVLHAIPIKREYISTLTGKFMEITRNLFFGYIMVALIQAVMAYIIFSIFHVRGALVFAGITFICVFIPMIGGGLVWLPLGLVRNFSGDIFGGILFLVVSGVFISLLDNFLRPMFLKDRIQLHPLIIFFAILGGISAFGFNGLILGPMVVILFLTVLDLFLTEHKISGD
ncbi:MAG: AI-2E family transporter [Treponema sp.]|jgi:predicted PurR-regulated permease PerM|nr:AI-2E family transporter [Treponema sp.]